MIAEYHASWKRNSYVTFSFSRPNIEIWPENPPPTELLKTIDIKGRSQGPKSTHIETENAEFVVGKEAGPPEDLLGSLAACINVIDHLIAKDHDIAIKDIDVSVEGDIDPAKYKGEATEPRAGFQTTSD